MGIMKDLMEKSDDLRKQIWSQAVMAADKDPRSITTGLFLQSLNETIDIHSKTAPNISSTGSRFRFPAHFLVDRVLKTTLYQRRPYENLLPLRRCFTNGEPGRTERRGC